MFDYHEIPPIAILRNYVKCYFVFQLEGHPGFSDIKYPNGQIEIAFNLGPSAWRSEIDNKAQIDPRVELLGLITQPMLIKSLGDTLMLGIRFYSHTAGYFFDHPLEDFNNQILDLRDVMGRQVKELYEQLLNETVMDKRVEVIERFLLKRLAETMGNDKLMLLNRVATELQNSPEKNVKLLASQYNMSQRNLQRLFLRYMGITPKLYGRISRFQQVARHIGESGESLTDVAYKFGFADQSHFIKDFKAFSETTPSGYTPPVLPFN